MSQDFQVGEQVLWNGATRIAQLFAATTTAVESLIGKSSGIGPVWRDIYQIEIDTYRDYLELLIPWICRTTHPIFRSMVDGYAVTALVLADRAGIEVKALREVADAATWIEKRDEAAHSMPF